MADLERTAEAWMGAVKAECPILPPISVATVALQRALLEIGVSQQELADCKQELSDFRQEVSDVMTYSKALYPTLPRNFNRFIIPAAKPDPLIEVLRSVGGDDRDYCDYDIYVKEIRAALDALGFEIREKNDV